MSRITITRQWPDGDALEIGVTLDHEYPDALDQARATTLRLYSEALDVTTNTDDDD